MGCVQSVPLQVVTEDGQVDSDKKHNPNIDISVNAGLKRSLSTESLAPIPEGQAVSLQSDRPVVPSNDYKRAFALAKKASFIQRKSVEEYTLEAVKEHLRQEWVPEYKPKEIRPPMATLDTISERSTTVTLSMLEEREQSLRKTKIVCTMGPKCWSEETLGKLIDNGMNVMRMNFSHGTHEAHLKVLQTFRQVTAAKSSTAASLLDTKGPEIRTSILRDHEPLNLEANQEITIEAVGERYTEFEGYKTPEETRIGLSYGDLCKSVKPGNKILLADGTLGVEVLSVLNDRELKGRVMNTSRLGERKNCNLPGVKVNLPILTEKDVDDLVNFACKHEVDFVAASFVQSADDVKRIRKVLDDAGGDNIKIISKIENEEGLKNFDEILSITDGVMVARGDLGMEIPSEKVPVAQKMIITKCNIAGKVVICATQMLESMISNPLPTRAEMTDVANAVFDGVDAVMLSGETANGDFALTAVSTMAAIVSHAEQAVDYYSQYSFLRYWNTRGGDCPLPADEGTISNASKMAVLFGEDASSVKKCSRTLVMCITETGRAANLVSKYRPPFPVVVVSNNDRVLRQCSAAFGQLAIKHCNLKGDLATMVLRSINAVEQHGIQMRNCKVVVVHNRVNGSADLQPEIKVLRTDINSDQKTTSGAQLLKSLIGDHVPRGVQTFRSTRTNLQMITKSVDKPRSTKILCTMGPKCWSEESLGKLIDAGLDIVRLNFSHGAHEQHYEVLERFRKVCNLKAAKMKELGVVSEPLWASLLDTKGPEIRTAMLKDHQPIDLVSGQDIIVEAVGDNYVSFEGYKTESETRIGLSYSKLCQSVVEGNKILIADGTIVIKVVQIINDRELRGTVLNTKQLGERKNCNLPGVKVLLPVLTEKDIHDLRNFGCKHHVDYVAASFVQSGEDVKFIRQVLREGGGEDIKIISKIENMEGLQNFDEILLETDGVMVARGDLGMEIPAEKVPLAQKMLITKCNIAGKFVVTATQMLESMITSPRPTRAEMTDIANAIIDGTDAVMLSGETANGAFPDVAVSTMAAICQNAEQMVTGHRRFDFLRNSTPKPMCDAEAVASAAVMTAMDIKAKAIVCLTTSGRAARLVSKYKPKVPILVVSPNESVIRQCRSCFGQLGILANHDNMAIREVVDMIVADSKTRGIVDLQPEDQIVLVGRRNLTTIDDQRLTMRTVVVGDIKGTVDVGHTAYRGNKTVFYRSTKIALDTILDDEKFKFVVRKTKIICTMGPKCWSEEMLAALLDKGMNVARLNFSHGTHDQHYEVLARFRKVCKEKGHLAASLLDTKGPEIRTAMLRNHEPINLVEGQSIIIEAVGDDYTTFEGYQEDNETRIGISYAKLCSSVAPGNMILLADGSVSIVVEEVLNDREVKGKVLNSKSLGERKNCNLPGVRVDIPVLTEKDINDLQNFACKHSMDFVAASFVQTKADVQLIRKVLDEAGGQHVKIISKIENAEGLKNFDEILELVDGVMVARGDLGMEIPVEKVPLAQKMMATKANIAGKFVICATQMMESIITNPAPTRAEITDVANAVFDGVDAVMLSGETANGSYPDDAVAIMAKICLSAELGVNYYQVFNYIRDFTPKPVGTVEAVASTMAKNAADVRPGMLLAFSEGGKTVRMISKYRPTCPVLVVTANPVLARQCSVYFSAHVMLLEKPIQGELQPYVTKALDYAVKKGLCVSGKEVLVLTSTTVSNEADPRMDRLPQRETYCTIAPGSLNYKCLGTLAPFMANRDPLMVANTVSLRSTIIDLNMLTKASRTVRKTKIIASLGPASEVEGVLDEMIQSGVNAVRAVLAANKIQEAWTTLRKFRKVVVAMERDRQISLIVDLFGMQCAVTSLKNESGELSKTIDLQSGDKVQLSWGENNGASSNEGAHPVVHMDVMGETTNFKEGDRLRSQGGTQFTIVSSIEGCQCVMEACTSGQVSDQDSLLFLSIDTANTAQMNACRSAMSEFMVDFVAVSGSVSAESLRTAISIPGLKILSKIDGISCLKKADEIIAGCDGIIVARDSLGDSIGAHKVTLAQNMLITRTNVAGKIAVLEGEILESMTSNLRPTRAEMTDVANSVFDGADCLLLGRETSCGRFPVESIQTAHAILQNAEQATNYSSVHSFIRDVSPKPFNTLEAAASAVAEACIDGNVGLCIVISDKCIAADLVAKYRPPTPQIVVTTDNVAARQSQTNFGQYAYLVPHYGDSINLLVLQAMEWAKKEGLFEQGENVAILHGSVGADADEDPVLRVVPSKDI